MTVAIREGFYGLLRWRFTLEYAQNFTLLEF